MSQRIRVGVIFGGKSGEHEVSILSGQSILKALDPEKYIAVPIGITRRGEWVVGAEAAQVLQEAAQIQLGGPPEPSSIDAGADRDAAVGQPGAGPHAVPASQPGETALTLVPPALVESFDVVIPVLHGPNGEDGTIQGMLELFDIPYVGAGVLASAVGMDKVFMKKLFASAGLPQAAYTFYTRKTWESDPEAVLADVEAKLGYPCFVKPANMGSSVGISKAKNRTGLTAAFKLAAKYDRKIIVEEGLNVREVEVAVLGNDEPKASVPGEIVPSNEFYDYNAKYVTGDSALIIPAPLPPDVTEEVRRLAVEAYRAVDCTGLARMDFFVERETDRVLVNEINTMPGFTRFSMYPKLWEATGVSYAELIDQLIQLAIERHRETRRRTFDL
ncbi:D-alanine--D-alanine ligase [Alicyclobacillus cycloheptanicus]|uniref:D-alanine--D-alanine ligase n=1 Tax=Alicyclobacillus cycloheptanicus TaxID=1457 RepID=A0ABT9XKG9_9BACL|nr:D-alanine--D-alanine ligase [Alicyclobacillus cycloheptanicus]MDQ0190793.1 D-alanine-D-alanine ligase [Alicyclobacillus cycloheptanicus]WDM02725.1 D-alanine--D-alanine ligase [Alicyclobacillus cycloheptanicus]